MRTLIPTPGPIPQVTRPTPPANPAGVELLSPADAARFLSVSHKQMENWRRAGKGGPPFHKLGKRLVRYRVVDLRDWVAQLRVESTAQGHALLVEGGVL